MFNRDLSGEIVPGGDDLLSGIGGVEYPAESLGRIFRLKRAFDIVVSILALPCVALVGLGLILCNPVGNPGPLFFHQRRMGRGCRPFTLIKFRSMIPVEHMSRGPDDPLEDGRITGLGRLMRLTRLDELPQFLNVLRGDMSLIGPRPDFWDHALHYCESIVGYPNRYSVRPGITGLAQVMGGYAEGTLATQEKTIHDLAYIRGAGLRMEAWVLWRTLIVVITGTGAR